MRSIFQMAIITGLVLVFDDSKVHGQYRTSKYELGVGLGTLVYQGDLTTASAGSYHSLKPSLSLSVSRLLTRHLGLTANVLFGKVTEDESRYVNPVWRQDRNLNFTSRMTEVSALAVWNLVKTDNDYQPRFIPYVFAGGGLTFLNTRKDWSKVNTAVYGEGSQVQAGLAIDTLKPANRLIGIIPVGVGLKYRFTSQMYFNTSFTYRLTTSDYIDGFKYSGNASRKDSYYGISLGVLYTFGRYKCPPVKP